MDFQKADGAKYAPVGKAERVVQKGEFRFAAADLEHGHINGMCNGLMEAGGELAGVYDDDPKKIAEFLKSYPGTPVFDSEEALLADTSLQLIAAAGISSERCGLGVRAMESGKHYFSDKPAFTTMEQINAAREVHERTGKRFMVYFGERIHSKCSIMAYRLVQEGAIGRVVQVLGLGPHRVGDPATRPPWFFKREQYGGILCDIGTHQTENFLAYSGAKDAKILHSKTANYAHKDTPELEDFGDATLVGDNGATGYFRVDWLTPKGLPVWGDGRTLIEGELGYIELRKYIDLKHNEKGNQLYLVNDKVCEQYDLSNNDSGYPFFGEMILDLLNGTEITMTQQHIFTACRLAVEAQMKAVRVE